MKKSELRKVIKEEVRRVLHERIEVVTNEYEISHGEKPKGSGGWAFRLEDTPRGQDGEIFWPKSRGAMTYKDSVKLAVAAAKEAGKNYVVVLP